jgi:leader peptidase (prepilin peptidase)/N-methyltransferase
MVFFWLFLVFVAGAVVGSFLNVCIYRIPLEKSVFWPGSRCGHCYQPIRAYDNIPLISYWLLRGRCRTCKTPFSPRYFCIELLTALCFTGLFYLEVVVNVNAVIYEPWKPPAKAQAGPPEAQVKLRANMVRLQQLQVDRGIIPNRAWVVFIFHAILLSFLIVITFCDLDRREIPLAVTGPGTIIGLIGSVVFPWPWPSSVDAGMLGMPANSTWFLVNPRVGPKAGLYPWPVWGPPPNWLPPGSWQLGLATGIAGALAGTFLLRTIGFLFTKGLGKEAMGLGDADLMMMVGAFLGWQAVVVAFFVSVIPGLLFAVIQVIAFRDTSLPFGPALAIGALMTLLGWSWLGPRAQVILFNPIIILLLGGGICVIILIASYGIRLVKLFGGTADEPKKPTEAQ